MKIKKDWRQRDLEKFEAAILALARPEKVTGAANRRLMVNAAIDAGLATWEGEPPDLLEWRPAAIKSIFDDVMAEYAPALPSPN